MITGLQQQLHISGEICSINANRNSDGDQRGDFKVVLQFECLHSPQDVAAGIYCRPKWHGKPCAPLQHNLRAQIKDRHRANHYRCHAGASDVSVT